MRNKKGPRTVAAVQRAERIKTMKHYITVNRILTVVAALIILGDIAMGVLIWKREAEARREDWAHSIPMANQRIEWSGAGYDGIYGRAD